MWVPGTTCKLTIDFGAEYSGKLPVDGDLLRSRTGKCYLLNEVRESPSIAGRVNVRCTRLDVDAVQDGEPGVWPIEWHPRKR